MSLSKNCGTCSTDQAIQKESETVYTGKADGLLLVMQKNKAIDPIILKQDKFTLFTNGKHGKTKFS